MSGTSPPPPPSGPPPGWYTAPGEPDLEQWWDGAEWTDHFYAPDQPGAPSPHRGPPQQKSAGTVAGGFKFGCGFFLFLFVGLPLIIIFVIAILAGSGDSSLLLAPHIG